MFLNNKKFLLLHNQLEEVTNSGKCFWQRPKSYLEALTILMTVFSLNVATAFAEKKQSDIVSDYIDYQPSPMTTNSRANGRSDFCTTDDCFTASEIFKGNVNLSVNPCDDFYEFACGNWKLHNPMPPSKSSWSSFSILEAVMRKRTKELLEQPKFINDPYPVNAAKDAYVACMDQVSLEQKGLAPVLDLLAQFGGWPMLNKFWTETSVDWQLLAADMLLRFYRSPFFTIYVAADDKDTNHSAISIDQPSPVMPRDILLNPELYADKHEAYFKYIAQTAFELRNFAGSATTDAEILSDVRSIIDLEIEVTKITSAPEERRDNNKMYHPMKVLELQVMTNSVSTYNYHPKIRWKRLLQRIFWRTGIDISNNEKLIVRETTYIHDLVSLLDKFPVRTIVNELIWQLLKPLTKESTQSLRNHYYEYRNAMSGTKEPIPRWEDCVNTINEHLGFAIGYKYIDNFFGWESKNTAQEMIYNVAASYKEILAENMWMDEATKAYALEKMTIMASIIGFPDWYGNKSALDTYYRGLAIRNEHIINLENMITVNNLRTLKELRKPTDRKQWDTNPNVVNAYYNPRKNIVCFPAGILQPPFFAKGNLAALNYGATGVLIGHEITHGYDDEGRQFGRWGELVQWWSSQTLKEYTAKAQCFVNQYGSFRVPEIDGLIQNQAMLNGITTQGENIADNGGLKEAFRAYQKHIQNFGQDLKLPDLPYTPEQLFFLAYANLWCSSITKETLLDIVLSDPHSPDRYRVLGAMMNSPEFASAWQCPLGSKMNPPEKCILW